MTPLAFAELRSTPERLRTTQQANVDEHNHLLEEIDWDELSVLPASERRVQEM